MEFLILLALSPSSVWFLIIRPQRRLAPRAARCEARARPGGRHGRRLYGRIKALGAT